MLHAEVSSEKRPPSLFDDSDEEPEVKKSQFSSLFDDPTSDDTLFWEHTHVSVAEESPTQTDDLDTRNHPLKPPRSLFDEDDGEEVDSKSPSECLETEIPDHPASRRVATDSSSRLEFLLNSTTAEGAKDPTRTVPDDNGTPTDSSKDPCSAYACGGEPTSLFEDSDSASIGDDGLQESRSPSESGSDEESSSTSGGSGGESGGCFARRGRGKSGGLSLLPRGSVGNSPLSPNARVPPESPATSAATREDSASQLSAVPSALSSANLEEALRIEIERVRTLEMLLSRAEETIAQLREDLEQSRRQQKNGSSGGGGCRGEGEREADDDDVIVGRAAPDNEPATTPHGSSSSSSSSSSNNNSSSSHIADTGNNNDEQWSRLAEEELAMAQRRRVEKLARQGGHRRQKQQQQGPDKTGGGSAKQQKQGQRQRRVVSRRGSVAAASARLQQQQQQQQQHAARGRAATVGAAAPPPPPPDSAEAPPPPPEAPSSLGAGSGPQSVGASAGTLAQARGRGGGSGANGKGGEGRVSDESWDDDDDGSSLSSLEEEGGSCTPETNAVPGSACAAGGSPEDSRARATTATPGGASMSPPPAVNGTVSGSRSGGGGGGGGAISALPPTARGVFVARGEAEVEAEAEAAVLQWAAGKDVVAMLVTIPELWPDAEPRVDALTRPPQPDEEHAGGGGVGGSPADRAEPFPPASVVRREYLRCVRKVHPDKVSKRRASTFTPGSLGPQGGAAARRGSAIAANDDPDALLSAALARKLFSALTDSYRIWMDTHWPNG